MTSSQKLAAFLSSAAKGEIDGFPKAGVQMLRVALTAKRSLLKDITASDPTQIDDAMVSIANLALSMRSDDAELVRLVHLPHGLGLGGAENVSKPSEEDLSTDGPGRSSD